MVFSTYSRATRIWLLMSWSSSGKSTRRCALTSSTSSGSTVGAVTRTRFGTASAQLGDVVGGGAVVGVGADPQRRRADAVARQQQQRVGERRHRVDAGTGAELAGHERDPGRPGVLAGGRGCLGGARPLELEDGVGAVVDDQDRLRRLRDPLHERDRD